MVLKIRIVLNALKIVKILEMPASKWPNHNNHG